MTKNRIIMPVLFSGFVLFFAACNGASSTNPALPAAPQADAVKTAVPIERESAVTKEVDVAAQAEDTSTVDHQPQAKEAVKAEVETVAKVEAVTQETSTEITAEDVTAEDTTKAVPFTGVIGLDTFSAYRLNFDAAFDGQRNGQPTTGELGSLFEVTHSPEAHHWQVNMAGAMFSQFAALGNGTVELYDLGDTVYIQNPQDGGFIGMPAFLVDSMLPADIYAPEENISLPVTAVPQPGVEMVNGIATQRYTFGLNDLIAKDATYDQVDGTIWVATDGNYVVKYQATITGQFENMATAGVELLDEGTVTMVYNLTDVNGDFTIVAPAGATALDLGNLFSN